MAGYVLMTGVRSWAGERMILFAARLRQPLGIPRAQRFSFSFVNVKLKLIFISPEV
jgi:hypothetical protein